MMNTKYGEKDIQNDQPQARGMTRYQTVSYMDWKHAMAFGSQVR